MSNTRSREAMQVIASLEAMQPYLQGADHIDVKSIDGMLEMRAFIAGMLTYLPWWIKLLYGIRAIFVRFLGMKQEAPPVATKMTSETVPMVAGQMATFFEVKAAAEESYWIAGATESHLTAHIGVVVEALDNGQKRFYVVTIVHYHKWTGPVYFNTIRPFHHLVVRSMMNAGMAGDPMHTQRTHDGAWLMGIAVFHNLVGIVLFWAQLVEIGGAGVFNSVDPHWPRATAFWFLYTGLVMFVLGWLTEWAHAHTGTLPAFLGWACLVGGLIGIILMPLSGFWLILPVGIGMIRTFRKDSPAKHPTKLNTSGA